MGGISDRLDQLGLGLPEPTQAPAGVVFSFDLVRINDGLAYVSGHGPVDEKRTLASGRVAANLSVADAETAARSVGRHARSPIGVASLPFDWPFELEAVVAVSP